MTTISDIIIGPIAQNIQLTPSPPPPFNVAHVVSNFSSKRLWSCMMAPIIFMADIATFTGGITCEFLQMLKKYLIDLSVPNFNVTDCLSFFINGFYDLGFDSISLLGNEAFQIVMVLPKISFHYI